MSTDERDHSARTARIEAAAATYRAAHAAYSQARIQLFDEILAGLGEDMGPSAAARASGFTREYIARIRDGKVKREL